MPRQGKHSDEKQWSADLRDTIGEPPRQEDVRHTAILSTEVLNQVREWASPVIGYEHRHLREGDNQGGTRPPRMPIKDAHSEDVEDGGRVHEEDRRVGQLDGEDGRMSPGRRR
jgi:hypothetical protein